MRVAIYARYSTDLQDKTSISGQFRNCEDLADRLGHDVAEHFSDEGITGTDDHRPGYRKLLCAFEDKRIDGVIVDETSRLTRSPAELHRLLAELSFRDQFVLDTKGFDSRDDFAPLLAGIFGAMDAMELKKIAARTHRGLRERHAGGHWTGGKVYGYFTEPTEDGKRRLVIDPDQGAVVRRIFRMYAAGMSARRICDRLNREGVPSPGSFWGRTKRRTKGWMHSALTGTAHRGTGMLRNELYVGRHVWNKRKFKKAPGTRKRIAEVRPESEWSIQEHPGLRIIDDALWQRVQTRLRETRERAHASVKKKRPRGRQPRHLLTGVLRCRCCEANYIVSGTSYACSSRLNGGKAICADSARLKVNETETWILSGIRDQLLSDETLRWVKHQVDERLSQIRRQHVEVADEIRELRDRLIELDVEIRNVTDAIAKVGISNALQEMLVRLERERGRVTARLQESTAVNTTEVIVDVGARWREIVADMTKLVGRGASLERIEAARDGLRQLLGEVWIRTEPGKVIAQLGIRNPVFMPNINGGLAVAGAGYQRYLLLVTALDIARSVGAVAVSVSRQQLQSITPRRVNRSLPG